MQDSTRPRATLDYKFVMTHMYTTHPPTTHSHNTHSPTHHVLCRYQSWPGTATVTFQKKHWFDADITIRWLKWLKAQFPGKKVGLIWDHAPAHTTGRVQEFIEECEDWLREVLIPGGLTSVMQLCDLIVNKLFKQYLREFYYKWRTAYIRRMKAKGVTGKLNIKLPRDEMIRLVRVIYKRTCVCIHTSQYIHAFLHTCIHTHI